MGWYMGLRARGKDYRGGFGGKIKEVKMDGWIRQGGGWIRIVWKVGKSLEWCE
jgi:hypothetical protein